MAEAFVYFIRASKLRLVKIGIAVRPLHRLGELQVGSPDRLDLIGVIPTDAPAELERELHKAFKFCRAHGEWFKPHEELEDFLASSLDPPPPRPIWRVADKIAAAVMRRKEAEAAQAAAEEQARLAELAAIASRPKPGAVSGSRHSRLYAYKIKRGLPV